MREFTTLTASRYNDEWWPEKNGWAAKANLEIAREKSQHHS